MYIPSDRRFAQTPTPMSVTEARPAARCLNISAPRLPNSRALKVASAGVQWLASWVKGLQQQAVKLSRRPLSSFAARVLILVPLTSCLRQCHYNFSPRRGLTRDKVQRWVQRFLCPPVLIANCRLASQLRLGGPVRGPLGRASQAAQARSALVQGPERFQARS